MPLTPRFEEIERRKNQRANIAGLRTAAKPTPEQVMPMGYRRVGPATPLSPETQKLLRESTGIPGAVRALPGGQPTESAWDYFDLAMLPVSVAATAAAPFTGGGSLAASTGARFGIRALAPNIARGIASAVDPGIGLGVSAVRNAPRASRAFGRAITPPPGGFDGLSPAFASGRFSGQAVEAAGPSVGSPTNANILRAVGPSAGVTRGIREITDPQLTGQYETPMAEEDIILNQPEWLDNTEIDTIPMTEQIRTTRTTSIPSPTKDRSPLIISADRAVTNTDLQAASLGIFEQDIQRLVAEGLDEDVAYRAVNQINERVTKAGSPAKKIKPNKEGYKVVWDPPAANDQELARVLRKRFIRLDKDGKERFIKARVGEGMTEAEALKRWKGLGKISNDQLLLWWADYRTVNPNTPWDIKAIDSNKDESLWASVGGIDFDHINAAAGAKGSGEFTNFTPLGHYLNRLKGKMDGKEFLRYLKDPKNKLDAVYEMLGGDEGDYARTILAM